MHARMTARTVRQVAGWSGLLAGAVLLASLLNAGVTNGTGGALAYTRSCCPSPPAGCEIGDGQLLYVALHRCVAEAHWGGDVSGR